jgi:DinB superfamily
MENIMSTSTETSVSVQPGIALRVLQEGYGPGAWHGPDLKAALAEVKPAVAFWRPAEGRHNIAEIALHHAYYVRAVRAQLSGRPAEPFVLTGEDWFGLDDGGALSWPKVQATVDSEQKRLTELVKGIEEGTVASPIASVERFNLVLGITCHAIYHAGQVQLIKRLQAE